MRSIPVYEPLFQGNEKKYLQDCIDTGWVSSEGKYVNLFEEAFAKWAGAKYAIAVSNGTAALETALWACGIKSGKILVTDSTIISCPIAIARVGAEPVFYDYKKLPSMCERNGKDETVIGLLEVCLFGEREFKHLNHTNPSRYFISDLSQYWSPKPMIGDAGCYSFYANKLITCGEGGMIITNSSIVYHNARKYRNLCHSSERFIHTDKGYNFRLSNLQAAVGLAQLEQIDKFIDIKMKNHRLYKKHFTGEFVNNPVVPWMYLVKTPKDAGMVVRKMKDKGISCRRFFYPLHRQRGFQTSCKYPASDYAWEHYLYLPSGLTLTEKDIKQVCNSYATI